MRLRSDDSGVHQYVHRFVSKRKIAENVSISGKGAGMIVLSFDDLRIEFSKSEANYLSVVFAIPFLRAQGSKFPSASFRATLHYSMTMQKTVIYNSLSRQQRGFAKWWAWSAM